MNVKERNIKILILEDTASDVELMEEQLGKHDFVFRSVVVETREDFVYQLNHFHPDLILADYTLPSFNGLEALDIVQTQKPEIPVIFVTGTLEVERAVETILKGAANFILKESLPSLPGAVYRALEAVGERRKRVEAENALRQSEEHFYRLFHANPIPASVSQLNTEKVIDINQALLDATGYQHNEIMGSSHTLHQLWHQPKDKERIVQRLQEQYTVRRQEVSLITKSGELRTFLVSAELLEINGEASVLMMYFDDTDRQRTIRELQEQSQALIRSNTELERFAYITSHDLRAPVVNISELIDLYDQDNLEKTENHAIIEKLHQSAHQLNNTLDQLIEVVALKNQTPIQKKWHTWRSVLDDVLLSIGQQISKTDTQITVDFSKAPKVLANRDYLQSILLNLLTNAIKYKKEDASPAIHFASHKEGGKTVLSVRDEGIGIDLDKYHNKIFGLYQQVSDKRKGKGLGLYIVKNQLERMGGSIQVKSQVNEYTEFTCYFLNV
ncbi:MAG: ATP-binding protein [Cyclobacteriaceae bacterium]